MKEKRPSQTAFVIAFRMAGAAFEADLRPLLSDPDQPYSRWFVAEHSIESDRLLSLWKAGGWPAKAFGKKEIFVLVRKRFIEDQVRLALAEGGLEQVVVLGAGYDPLSLRLARDFPKVRFYEIDHPDTQEVKRRALEARQAIPPGLVLIPVDFDHEPGQERLRAAAGFRPEACSLFLAEGVLMYLAAADVEALFRLVARNAGKDSRFVFTMAEPRMLNEVEPAAPGLAAGLAQIGEPIRSTQDPKEMEEFLRARGFVLRGLFDHRSLRETYMAPLGIERPLREGEFVVLSHIK